MDSLISIKEKKGYEPLERKPQVNPETRKSFERNRRPDPEPLQDDRIEEEVPTKMEEEEPQHKKVLFQNDEEEDSDEDLTRHLRKKSKPPQTNPSPSPTIKQELDNMKFEELESSFDLEFNQFSKVSHNGNESLKRRPNENLHPGDNKQIKLEPEAAQNKPKPDNYLSAAPTTNQNKASPAMKIGTQTEYKRTPSRIEDKDQYLEGDKTFNFDPESFKGVYMLNLKGYKQHYCKVQLLKTYIKVENGIRGDSRSQTTQYYIYRDRNVALKKAKDEIEQMLAQGYTISNKLFEYNFKETEPGLKAGLSNRLPRSVPTSPQQRIPMNGSPIIHDSSQLKSASKTSHFQQQEAIKENRQFEEDDISDSYSYLDDLDFGNFNKRPQIKRTETRVRSVSPERNSHSVFNRGTSEDFETDLGPPVDGIYESLQMPTKFDRKDPKGWYLSEKLDSVRAFWDGATLYSKKGKKYNLPDYFCDNFPESALDGELYMGKGNAHKLTLLLQKKKPKDEEWNDVKFIVYDAPELKLPFKDRLDKLRQAFRLPVSPYITLAEYKLCGGSKDLAEELDRVEKSGGEGFLLRDPKGFYVKGKSSSVLDVNAFHYEEAEIIGHEQGKGKYEGLTGGLQVQNVYGIVFSVTTGMTDAWRKNPPKIGSKISYKFQSVNDMGVPLRPIIVRAGDD